MLSNFKSYTQICMLLLVLIVADSESRTKNISGKTRRAAGYYTTRFGRSDPSIRLQELAQKRRDHMDAMKTSFIPDLPQKIDHSVDESYQEIKHNIDDILEEKPMLFCVYSKERSNYVCAKVPWITDVGRPSFI